VAPRCEGVQDYRLTRRIAWELGCPGLLWAATVIFTASGCFAPKSLHPGEAKLPHPAMSYGFCDALPLALLEERLGRRVPSNSLEKVELEDTVSGSCEMFTEPRPGDKTSRNFAFVSVSTYQTPDQARGEFETIRPGRGDSLIALPKLDVDKYRSFEGQLPLSQTGQQSRT
jgi:hypothetical protein